MKNLLLIQILKSFSKDEVKKFDEFLKSPFFNKKPNAAKFFAVLKKHSPDYKEDAVKKERIWKELYPGKKYNWGVLKNLIFNLTILSEKFIEVMQYENSFLENKFHYLDALSKRQIHNKFFSEYNSLLKKCEKSMFYQNYYSDIQKLILKKLNHCSIHTNYYNDITNELSKASDYQITDSIVKLSCLYSDIAISSVAENKSGKRIMSELFLGNVDINKMLKNSDVLVEKDINILQVYYYKYLSCSDPEIRDNYFKYKEALIRHSGLFSRDEKSILYIQLADLLNLRSARKEDNKLLEFLELYKMRIDENIFTESDGSINIYSYTNIIKMAGKLSDHKLIKFVRDNFLELLLPEFKENMRLYTDAHYYYSSGNYEKALERSLKLKLDHFNFKFDIKDLQTMIYYELGDYESFMYHIDSYKHFLKQNRSVSNEYRKWYSRYNSAVYRLLKIKLNFDDYELKKLEDDVLEGNTGSKQWFTERIDQLRKQHNVKANPEKNSFETKLTG